MFLKKVNTQSQAIITVPKWLEQSYIDKDNYKEDNFRGEDC
jgi:hypothetical protein